MYKPSYLLMLNTLPFSYPFVIFVHKRILIRLNIKKFNMPSCYTQFLFSKPKQRNKRNKMNLKFVYFCTKHWQNEHHHQYASTLWIYVIYIISMVLKPLIQKTFIIVTVFVIPLVKIINHWKYQRIGEWTAYKIGQK